MKNEDWLEMKKLVFHITFNHLELLVYAIHIFW